MAMYFCEIVIPEAQNNLVKGNRRRICTSDLEKSIIFSTKQSQESLQNPVPSQDKVESITSKNVGPSNKLLEPRCGTQRNMEGEAHPRKIIFWVVGREYCGWLEEDPTMWNTTGYTQWMWGASQGKSTPQPICPNSTKYNILQDLKQGPVNHTFFKC